MYIRNRHKKIEIRYRIYFQLFDPHDPVDFKLCSSIPKSYKAGSNKKYVYHNWIIVSEPFLMIKVCLVKFIMFIRLLLEPSPHYQINKDGSKFMLHNDSILEIIVLLLASIFLLFDYKIIHKEDCSQILSKPN